MASPQALACGSHSRATLLVPFTEGSPLVSTGASNSSPFAEVPPLASAVASASSTPALVEAGTRPPCTLTMFHGTVAECVAFARWLGLGVPSSAIPGMSPPPPVPGLAHPLLAWHELVDRLIRSDRRQVLQESCSARAEAALEDFHDDGSMSLTPLMPSSFRGTIVKVLSSEFSPISLNQDVLREGELGILQEVDADGDACVLFPAFEVLGVQWFAASDFDKLVVREV